MSDRDGLDLIQKDVQYIREKIDDIVKLVNNHDTRIRDIELQLAGYAGEQKGIRYVVTDKDRRFKILLTVLILLTSAVNVAIALFR